MELNDREETPAFYDAIYKTGGRNGVYHRPPLERTGDMDMWLAAIRKIDFRSSIVEFGCGTGQFAQLAIESGRQYKVGIDYSPEAIRLCRVRLPDAKGRFLVHNLYNTLIYTCIERDDVVVMLELLEHLSEDFFILENLPPGTKVIFSVPDFGGQSHVRKFRSEQEILDRYGGSVNILNITRFGRRYLGAGYRR